MPAPTVTPHRVGRNAVVTINGSSVDHQGGTVRTGGGTDTVTYPDGYDRSAKTNSNASGDLTVIVTYGAAPPVEGQTYITLVITDGTNTIYSGTAYVTEVSNQFANDQGWTYTFSWLSHGEF